MGQNSAEPIDSKTTLVQQWLPYQRDINVLVNKVTHQQVQRHFVKILIKDLPRQIAHFASRMSNHQPNICRLLYFHPSVPDSRSSKDQKDFREMYLYTDRMLPLQHWNQENLTLAIQGLQKLVSVHGPFRIAEKMICQNELQEVRVWMSENPISNHQDTRYMSQEQTVADIAAILTKKNQDLASKLLGCHTMRDVFQKLNQTYRQNKSPFHNYSHRASESGEIKLKKYQKLEKPANSQHYRNVFGNMTGQAKPNLTPTKTNHTEFFQNNYRKQPDQSKPNSNLSQYKDYIYLHSNKCMNKEDKIGERAITNAKMIKDTSIDFKKDPILQKQMKSNHNDFCFRSPEGKGNVSSFQPQKQSPIGPHRFETSSKLGTPNPFNFPSQKNFKSTSRANQEPPNNSSSQLHDNSKGSSFYSSSPNIHKIQGKRGYDITIINNNVSNYYNNIVHNHVVTLEKKGSENYLSQTRKTEGQDIYSSHKQAPIHDSNVQKPREKSAYVPVFIKKRICTRNQDSANTSKNQRQNFLARQDTIDSNPSSSFNHQQQSPPPILQNITEKKQNKKQLVLNFAPKNFEKKTQKTYNFSRNKVSPNKIITKNPQVSSFYPKTPTPNSSFTGFQSSFSSFLTANDRTMPLRTKTTEFYRKGVQRKDEVLQNKSFTINEENQKPKQIEAAKSHKPLEDNFIKNISQLTEPTHFLRNNEAEAPSPQQKTNLKKQLRQQFKFLLGGDPPANDQPKTEEPKLQKSTSARVEIKKEGQVKEKIIKKQIAFAQLKKQALKVLD